MEEILEDLFDLHSTTTGLDLVDGRITALKIIGGEIGITSGIGDHHSRIGMSSKTGVLSNGINKGGGSKILHNNYLSYLHRP